MKKRVVSRKRKEAKAKQAPASSTKTYSYERPGPFGKVGRSLGSAAGYGLANFFGAPHLGSTASAIGSKLGGLAHYVGRIFGSGDYSLAQPPEYNSLFKGSKNFNGVAPNVTFGDKSVRIRHREYIADVISSSANYGTGNPSPFNTVNYQINPGLSQSFPWLSQVANAYQTYKWHGLVAEFKTTSVDALNSTNTALGVVVMAADYNSTTFVQDFESKQEMLNFFGAIDVKPSQSCLMGIECDSKRLPISELYVRSGALQQNADIRMNDMCAIGIATQGLQGVSVTVGELWFIYDIELFMPVQLPPGSTALMAQYVLPLDSISDSAANNLNEGYFGASAGGLQIPEFDNIGLLFGVDSSLPINYIGVSDRSKIPSGSSFLIEWVVSGASQTNLGCPTPAVIDGVVNQSIYTAPRNPAQNATATQSSISYWINIPDNSQLINLTSMKFPMAPAGCTPVPIAGLVHTTVPSSTTAVPDTPITYAVLRVFQVNGQQMLQ